MSLFDWLRCEYPLPDGCDPMGIEFQTEDTPEPYLRVYGLRADGVLIDATTGEPLPYHGALRFSASNVSVVKGDTCITKDDDAPWWAEYTALYDHGTLLKLEGRRQPYTAQRQVSRAAFYARQEEKA